MNATYQAPLGLSKPHTLRAALLFLACTALCVAIPLLDRPYLYTLVAAMLLCLLVPAWIDWQRHRFEVFEPIHAMGAVYFTLFGLGAIWTVSNPGRVAYDWNIEPFIPRAVLYCLFGYVAMLVGYYGFWGRRRERQPYFEREIHPLALALLAGVGAAGYVANVIMQLAIRFSKSISTLTSSLTQLTPLFLFCWAVLWQLFYSGRATRVQRLILFGLLTPLAVAIVYLTVSSKAVVMILIGIPVIAYWSERRRVPWRILVALLLLLIFAIFPFYNTYRSFDPRLDTSERVRLTYRALSEWDARNAYTARSVGMFEARLALINSVAVVLRDAGRWVPYAKGETLLSSLAFFIPRVVWPDKPKFMYGREFGVTFRVVGILDKRTSIAATVPGELYWNFGLPGILIGMLLWGAMMRGLYRRYGEGVGHDPVRRAILIVVLIELGLAIGGHSGQLVALFRTLLVFEGIRWVGRRYGLITVEPAAAPARAVAAPAAAR